MFFGFFCFCVVFFGFAKFGSADNPQHILELRSLLRQVENGVERFKNEEFPVVTASFAQTLDGAIAPKNRSRWNLSSPTALSLLHSIRARSDGILIGINTLDFDEPRLNVRCQVLGTEINNPRPTPIIFDSKLRFLNLNRNKIFVSRPIVCCTVPKSDARFLLAQSKLAEIGGRLIYCDSIENRIDIHDAFKKLKRECGINTMLLEGGAELIKSVFEKNLCHQVVVTLKPCYSGGYNIAQSEYKMPVWLKNISVTNLESDIMIYGNL